MGNFDPGRLGLVWAAPFAGLLLSVAIMPMAVPHLRPRHHAAVAALWSLGFVLPFAAAYGATAAASVVFEALVDDYLPFIVLLTALFAVAGGINLTGTIRGTPAVNTLLLLIGSLAASVMGTTGAAMLLVRPLIRANRHRVYKTHIFVFLVFLVGNIGGALTPLGDPPLLIGYIQGVPFLWPAVHLAAPTGVAVAILLALFYGLDRHFYRRGFAAEPEPLAEIERLGVDGKINLLLLALVLAVAFAGGAVVHPAARLAADAALIVIAVASLRLTPSRVHHANDFTWAPMIEVAVLFAAIFVTVAPVLMMLRAGPEGAAAGLKALVHDRAGEPLAGAFFWLTGILSSVLDNAPTYLVFFNLAGGDAATLAGPLHRILAAISAGAVMMGAMTYIGNAPNIMVKTVCAERGVAMPGFFGYLRWSGVILLPLYGLITLLFFR